MTDIKPTERWWQLATVYAYFAREHGDKVDWSLSAAQTCFLWESEGEACDERNGYAVGKGLLNLTLQMWREDLRKGYICKGEILDNLPPMIEDKVVPMLAGTTSNAFSWVYDRFERIHAEMRHHRLRMCHLDPLTAC